MQLQTRLEIRVEYAAPARDCRRILRVLPLHRAGQMVEREAWCVVPAADWELENRDALGNRRLLLHHARIERELRFGLDIEAQTTGAPVLDLSPDRAQWKMPSRAVLITTEMQRLAREARELPILERAAHFSGLCARRLEYDGRAVACPLSSEQVWMRRRGGCADFAHAFLALCRSSGMLARYVAGYSRSQGQMHAWAEVWAPNGWHAFDATAPQVTGATRRPVLHLAVAVGRDFYDCAPHAGQFRGAGEARIEVWCQTRRLEEHVG